MLVPRDSSPEYDSSRDFVCTTILNINLTNNLSRFERYTFDRILDSPLGIRREYLLNRITFSLSLSISFSLKNSPLNAHGYD